MNRRHQLLREVESSPKEKHGREHCRSMPSGNSRSRCWRIVRNDNKHQHLFSFFFVLLVSIVFAVFSSCATAQQLRGTPATVFNSPEIGLHHPSENATALPATGAATTVLFPAATTTQAAKRLSPSSLTQRPTAVQKGKPAATSATATKTTSTTSNTRSLITTPPKSQCLTECYGQCNGLQYQCFDRCLNMSFGCHQQCLLEHDRCREKTCEQKRCA